MAIILSLDFKHGHYVMAGEEVTIGECLVDYDPMVFTMDNSPIGGSLDIDPAIIVPGVGWKLGTDDLGKNNWRAGALLTAAARAVLSPYLQDGGVTARIVYSLDTDGDAQAAVALDFTEGLSFTYLGQGWTVVAFWQELPNANGFLAELGNVSTYYADTEFVVGEGRQCLAAFFGPEEMAVSVNGAAATSFAGVPEDFSFDQARLQAVISAGSGAAYDATAIIERVDFYVDTFGGGFGGSGDDPVPPLTTISILNPDGSGDGLVDDSIRMRCWSFSLDGHDFAVFRLGSASSLVYDLTTNSWSEWASPALDYFRAHIGQNWLGASTATLASGSDIVAGDDASGVLWILDPEYGRDDRSTTSSDYFERVVTGGLSVSGRDVVPCGAVTLDCSVGNPTQTGAAVQLEISDDFGHVFTDCGSVTVVSGERDAVVEWRALGTIRAPGRVFRLTDNGATARIAGLDLR